MRCLKKNQRKLYYANYSGSTEILDDSDHFTGEFQDVYTGPFKVFCNVREASGSIYVAPFGTTVTYQYSFVIDDPDFPITDQSIIWYGIGDIVPTVSGNANNNCRVKYISRSINSITCYFEDI